MDQAILEKAATLLQRLDGFFDEGGEFPTVKDRLKAIEGLAEKVEGLEWTDKLKDFDPTSIEEKYEQLKAGQTSIRRQIQNSKGGLYVSGIEDYAEKFNMMKAVIAVKTGNWSQAGLEKELIDQVREKHFVGKQSHIAGDDVLGGNFIPDQVIPDIIEAIYTRSAMIDLTGDGQTRMSVLDGLTGGNVRVPKFDGGTIAYWIGEEDTYAESQVATGDMTLQPHKLGVLVRITDTMARLQSYGFDALVRNDMTRAAAKKIDYTALLGTGGNNMPLGLFHEPNVRVFAAEDGNGYANDAALLAGVGSNGLAGAELDFDSLDDMLLYLEEDDIDVEAQWMSSPRFFKRLRRQKVDHYTGQATNQAYLLGAPMIPDSRLREVIGDYGKTTQMASNQNPGLGIIAKEGTTNDGKCTGIAGGDFTEMVFGRWSGIEIEDDGGRGTGFTSDHTYIKLRMYADIGYRQTRRLIKCYDAKVRD